MRACVGSHTTVRMLMTLLACAVLTCASGWLAEGAAAGNPAAALVRHSCPFRIANQCVRAPVCRQATRRQLQEVSPPHPLLGVSCCWLPCQQRCGSASPPESDKTSFSRTHEVGHRDVVAHGKQAQGAGQHVAKQRRRAVASV